MEPARSFFLRASPATGGGGGGGGGSASGVSRLGSYTSAGKSPQGGEPVSPDGSSRAFFCFAPAPKEEEVGRKRRKRKGTHPTNERQEIPRTGLRIAERKRKPRFLGSSLALVCGKRVEKAGGRRLLLVVFFLSSVTACQPVQKWGRGEGGWLCVGLPPLLLPSFKRPLLMGEKAT